MAHETQGRPKANTAARRAEESQMSHWSSGYVADIGYIYGCYNELSLERIRMAFLSAGLKPPRIETACELGYGQGLAANLCAAATQVEWHGTDFLPAQAAYAQELAAASGSGARFLDEAFADYCHRTDLPDFDFIALHGIWSWVNDENRRLITDFIRRKLKVGGIVYIGYNTSPGWANMIPMRDLLVEHAQRMGSPGEGTASRIGNALDFGDKLLALNPAYAAANPEIRTRFAKLKSKDRAYLAHEFFNRDWLPTPFARMADWLEPTKVDFAAPAHLLEHADEIQLTPQQLAFVRAIPQSVMRQTARDYFVDQQFRRDYWVKGLRRIGFAQQAALWRDMRIALATPRADVTLKAKGPAGEIDLQADVYTPLLDLLADHQVHSLPEVEAALAARNFQLPHVLQSVRMLYAKGDLVIVQDDATAAAAKDRCRRLNSHLMERSRHAEESNFLASPVSGAGFGVARFQQLFLLARREGHHEARALADFGWNVLQANREKIMRDGRPLVSPEENIAELVRLAEDFVQHRLRILTMLGIE